MSKETQETTSGTNIDTHIDTQIAEAQELATISRLAGQNMTQYGTLVGIVAVLLGAGAWSFKIAAIWVIAGIAAALMLWLWLNAMRHKRAESTHSKRASTLKTNKRTP
ncbi:MAG: hypothetical protein AABZ53_14130 [Planctomycetota bacterium]